MRIGSRRSASTKPRLVPVLNPNLTQRFSELRAIELRIPARTRKASHINQHFNLMRQQYLAKLFTRARRMPHCPDRNHLLELEARRPLKISLKFEPPLRLVERLPQVAELADARRYVVDTEVINRDPALQLFPTHRRRDRRQLVRPY